MKNIQSQSQTQHRDRLDPRHFRALGAAAIQLGQVNEGNLRDSAGSIFAGTWAKESRIPSAETKTRDQKLTTPILIRILRCLVHCRAFQQRKAKPFTSHIKGPVAAAVASLKQPCISSAINRDRSDFKFRRVTRMTTLANAVFLCAAVLSMSEAMIVQTQAKNASCQSNQSVLSAVHGSKGRLDAGEPNMDAIDREKAQAGNIRQPVMKPTRSTFLAKWRAVRGATGYRLDVSNSPSFESYVGNYRNLDLGNATCHVVSGLNRGTRYYYRVRPYGSAGTESNSETRSETTANITSGLVIAPTFDSTITNDPRANEIQAMIISAIQMYQTLFDDSITVSIYFRFSPNKDDGTPMGNLIGASNSGTYRIDWDTYIASLKADSTTQNDAVANATLPTNPLSAMILTKSAAGRAIGLDTPTVIFADGSIGVGGPYDGIITINSAAPVQFTRPVAASNYDAQMFTEHEIDEVLGLGSHLAIDPDNLAAQDLFSWASLNARNTSSTGLRFFSIDGGFHNLAQFNQNPDGDFGDWDSDNFCPADRLFVQNAVNCASQSTDFSATSPEGINLDVIGYHLIPDNSVLGNISTRLWVGTGDNVLIAGFTITGNEAKQLVVRALGPSLTQFDVPDAMQDTTLELHDSTGAVIAFNDDWQDAANAQSIPPNLQPSNDLESAILTTLNPGTYTAIVRGFQNSTGTAMVEVYDMSVGSTELSNISTRGFVQTGNDVMIAGVIVQFHDKQVIVRALGPTLTNFGVPNALTDPTLELHDANGVLLAFNDNWKDTQQNAIAATGLAPPNDLESAIVATFAPGNYTAIVRGFNNTSGNALVEVYALN
jgi:hypothetical protein